MKYYNKQPQYENYGYQRRQRQNRRIQEHPKTSSYQDYKKGLREQKYVFKLKLDCNIEFRIKQVYRLNRSHYDKEPKYSEQRPNQFVDPGDSYEQPQSYYSNQQGM